MKKVLVVEDDLDALRMISEALRSHGYTVRAVASGVDALRAIEEDCPHVVVSDLVMPVMDGNTLLRRVRSMADKCPVRFIVLTGQPTVTKVVDAVTIGADEVLLKPVDIDKLLAVIGDPVGEAS